MSETVTVRRGGSYLTISPNAVDRYIAKGYDVVDDSGNILQAGTPNDVNTLKRAYEAHIAEIKRLKEEIESLKSKPKSEPSKQSNLFVGTEVEEPEIKIEDEPVERKTTSRRSRKSV